MEQEMMFNISYTTHEPFLSNEQLYFRVRSFPEYKAFSMIWKYCPPVLLLLGGFGNVATIFVLRRINWGHSTQHVFLTALAVVDLALLCTGLLRQWLKYEFDIDIRVLHSVVCKFHTWLVYSLGASSAWLLTAVTVQRAMSVVWPHRMNILCNNTRTGVAVCVVLLCSFGIYSQNLFVLGIVGPGICYQVAGTVRFLIIWSWIDLMVASLLPAFILLVCNVFLALTLHRSARESSAMRTTQGSAASSDDRSKKAMSMTITVMTLSMTFIFLTLPTCVYLLWSKYMVEQLIRDVHLLAKDRLFSALVNILWYTNSTVNFLLYCMSGTKFRNAFIKLISCGRLRMDHTVSHRGQTQSKGTSFSTVSGSSTN